MGLKRWPIQSKEFGLHYQELTSENVTRVRIYGGCKSAVDVTTLCITADKKIDRVFRDTGNGLGAMGAKTTRDVHGARRW